MGAIPASALYMTSIRFTEALVPVPGAQNRHVDIWLCPRDDCDLQLIFICKALSSPQKKRP